MLSLHFLEKIGLIFGKEFDRKNSTNNYKTAPSAQIDPFSFVAVTQASCMRDLDLPEI
jgi:hypothetical protein